MLDQALPAALFSLALVFARIGAMIMVLPVFGEQYVQARFRLVLAVLLTLIIAPKVGGLPVLPTQPGQLIPLTAGTPEGDEFPGSDALLVGVAAGALLSLPLVTCHG